MVSGLLAKTCDGFKRSEKSDVPVEAETVQALLAWLVNRIESRAGILLLSAIWKSNTQQSHFSTQRRRMVFCHLLHVLAHREDQALWAPSPGPSLIYTKIHISGRHIEVFNIQGQTGHL